MKLILTTLCGMMLASPARGGPAETGNAINQFGLDLHRRLAADGGNLVVSPWSIEAALAMTYAGANGKTKEEMAAVLHFPKDETETHGGFSALMADLKQLMEKSQKQVKQERGGSATPLEIRVANRLFGQKGFVFEKAFLDLTATAYGAVPKSLDFAGGPAAAAKDINDWIEEETGKKIRNLIPPGMLSANTSLVLANAVYLKASWPKEFRVAPAEPFFVNGGEEVKVPTLTRQDDFGYVKFADGQAVTLPYAGGGVQFVMLIPDAKDGLATLEKALKPELFSQTAHAKTREIILHFPKFKLEPERVMLAEPLGKMGMSSAFDKPAGTADFTRMAPRKADKSLCVKEVIHKAILGVDQFGTEATAATAVDQVAATATKGQKPEAPKKPLEIRVDRPFVFAIQHQASGACLFLGRVTDPRNPPPASQPQKVPARTEPATKTTPAEPVKNALPAALSNARTIDLGPIRMPPMAKFQALDTALGTAAIHWKEVMNLTEVNIDPDTIKDTKVGLPALLGFRICDGILAIKARDAEKLNTCAIHIEKMAKRLGVTEADLKRAKIVRSFANHGEWERVFMELGFLQQDIETVLKRESGVGARAPVIKILYAAGWLQGARYTSGLVNEHYNKNTAGILREPQLVKEIKAHLDGAGLPNEGIVKLMSDALAELQQLVNVELRAPVPKANVETMAKLTKETVLSCVKLAK